MRVPSEFFELISKAQSHRADDQRGLLNKSDLQLPDFLRLSPDASDKAAPPPYDPEPSRSARRSRNSNHGSGRRGDKADSNDRGGGCSGHLLNASRQSQSLDSALGNESRGGRKARPPPPPPPPFPGTLSPHRPSPVGQHHPLQDAFRGESVQMPEEDALSDLTLVGEGDINSPSLNYLSPSALQCKRRPHQHARDGRPSSGSSAV